MKKRDATEPLLVVIFTLLPKEEAGEGNQAEEKKAEEAEDDELD